MFVIFQGVDVLRKIAVVGDMPNTGGIILPNGNSTFSIGDGQHKAALIGGQVRCDACGSIGKIAKAGGPRRMNFMGEVALEGDLVLCKCPLPPKLVASLSGTVTYDDGVEAMGAVSSAMVREVMASSAFVADPQASVRSRCYDEQIKFMLSSGAVLAGAAYILKLDDGSEIAGTTDGDGMTARIETDESHAIIEANLKPGRVFCCARQVENATGGSEGDQGLDFKLEGIKTNSDNLGSSVIEHVVDEKNRPLTVGEVEMAKKVFRDSIDYLKVKVHKGAYIPFAGSNAMTPNGEMYFPAEDFKPDFSVERDTLKVWFIHEMTHVWQYQLGYSVFWNGIVISIKRGYGYGSGQDTPRAYRYDVIADLDKPMSEFNMEQQGDLVSHYFDGMYLEGDGSIRDHAEYVANMNFYARSLANFLRDPKDASSLPATTHIED